MIMIGDYIWFVMENELVYVLVGVVYCIVNEGKVLLELIEVRIGSYIVEDDIQCIEDIYVCV